MGGNSNVPTLPEYLRRKAGGRLLQALQFLREQGLQNLKSGKGGINAWANEIDRTVPRY